MQEKNKKVGVGVGVLVNKDNKILLIKRQGAHGEGTWAPPGGHVDFGETAIQAAQREVEEEVGLEVENPKVIGFTEDLFKKDEKHYITIWIECDWKSGTARAKNNEMSEIGWFSWENLPQPLFIPLQNLVDGKVLPISSMPR